MISKSKLMGLRSKFFGWSYKKRLTLISTLAAFSVAMVQVIPTLAENIVEAVSGDQQAENVSPGVSSSPTPEPEVTEESEEVEEGQEEEATEDLESTEVAVEAQPLPPPPPPQATSNQEMMIRMPTSLRVDPRAVSTFMPYSIFFSFNTLLLCISSSTLKFDVGQHGIVDDGEGGALRLRGDLTNEVLLSGNPSTVSSYVNNQPGLRIFRDSGGIARQVAVFRFVDVTEPTLDGSLCDEGVRANARLLEVLPLGLTQNISKAKLDIGKKSGAKG